MAWKGEDGWKRDVLISALLSNANGRSVVLVTVKELCFTDRSDLSFMRGLFLAGQVGLVGWRRTIQVVTSAWSSPRLACLLRPMLLYVDSGSPLGGLWFMDID